MPALIEMPIIGPGPLSRYVWPTHWAGRAATRGSATASQLSARRGVAAGARRRVTVHCQSTPSLCKNPPLSAMRVSSEHTPHKYTTYNYTFVFKKMNKTVFMIQMPDDAHWNAIRLLFGCAERLAKNFKRNFLSFDCELWIACHCECSRCYARILQTLLKRQTQSIWYKYFEFLRVFNKII